MGSRFTNVLVVLFWLATMSWLVVNKVLPPLRIGEPPDYRSIIAKRDPKMPICWQIMLNDKPLGWAASRFVSRPDEMVESRSQVYLDYLPIDQIAPGWLGTLMKPLVEQTRRTGVDINSRIDIDPLGRLVMFESKMRLANYQDAIRMQGQVEGSNLQIHVQSGEFSYRTERYLPSHALVTDELSPQAQLPGLRIGQQWTMPVYSPFRPPNSPLEILHATVERESTLAWNGGRTRTHLVVYRTDPGSTGAAGRESQGKLWVRLDGLVLKQELLVMNSKLQFVRMSPGDGHWLMHELGTDWGEELPAGRSQQVFSEITSAGR